MDTLKMCGVALIASFAAMLLREVRRDLDIPVRIAAAVLLLGAGVAMAAPLAAYLGCDAGAALGDDMEVLVRALAVALAVKLAADICRECGAAGVGSALETVGKIEVLLLSLPLFRRALDIVGDLAGI